METYLSYFKSCGYVNIMMALSLSLAAYSLAAVADYQVAFWTDGKYSNEQFITIYALMASIVIAANFGRYIMYNRSGIVGSQTLHHDLLCAILGGSFEFFNKTPSGRITSRFSVDFDVIDFSIPSGIASQMDAFLGIFTGVGVVIVSSPLYLIVVGPLAYKYLEVQRLYRNVSTVLKKIDSGSVALIIPTDYKYLTFNPLFFFVFFFNLLLLI